MVDIIKELQELKRLIESQALLNKDVLTLNEACSYTGISKSFMYKLSSTGRIPCSQPTGKLLFFNRLSLNEWLLSNQKMTQDEIEKKASEWIKKNGRTKR